MIRNTNRNISVAKGHGYEFSKVKYAVDFVNKAGRNTTVDDWVNAYNHIKGTDEDAKGCRACKAAKFQAGVRNYARYGYLTLLNEGYKPEDFLETPVVENNVESEENQTTENVCIEEKQANEVAEAEQEKPKKVGRPKKS